MPTDKDFLQWLDPDAESFVFQTFDDAKRGMGGSTYGAPSLTEELRNLNAHGFGVSVTINELMGDSRRSEHVTRIRAAWFDDDSSSSPEDREWPLPPSVIVQTSASRFHYYWLVSDHWAADDKGREDFRGVMSALVEMGADRNARDIARAMRLPGSYHRKGEPFLVSIVYPQEGEAKRYSREELVSAFSLGSFAPVSALAASSTEHPRPSTVNRDSVNTDSLRFALDCISPDERETWIKVGMALKSASNEIGGEEEAFALWDQWSRESDKYDPRESLRQWQSFREHENGIGLGSLFFLACTEGAGTCGPAGNGVSFRASLPAREVRKAEAVNKPEGSLADQTLTELKATFAQFDHNPSGAQWEALVDLARRLEALADGAAQPFYFLSSLDPGIGKTQTIIHFVRALLGSPGHEGVAVLICLGRLAEIKSYVADMGLGDGDFAVLVSETADNAKLNGLGTDRDKARVLFTTQQMLESRVKRQGSFSEVSDFWFNGKPRQVRLWDEACLPARPLTVEVTGIDKLTANARQIPALLERIERLASDIRDAENGGRVSVPDFETETGVSVAAALGLYIDENRSVTETVRDLYLLQGNTVVVTRDGRNREIIHYENTLPDDLKPVVICDASGRVRQTYPHWAQGRGDLVELTKAEKNYDDMTIHLWRHAGSKDAWDNKAKASDMLRAIVDVVNTRPEEEFLIIHHMVRNSRSIDLPAYVKTKAINPDRLRFTHWNSEDCKATNQFKDIPNIILAGTLFYPSSYHEALGKLSRAMAPDEGLNKQYRREIEQGEHAHLILQAVCRGTARKAIGNKSGRADVWIIAAEKSGIPNLLGTIFPRSKIVPWMPVAATGRVGDAINVLTNWAKGPERRLAVSEFRTMAGEKDKDNFNKRVIRTDEFNLAQKKLGLRYVPAKGSRGAFIEKEDLELLPI